MTTYRTTSRPEPPLTRLPDHAPAAPDARCLADAVERLTAEFHHDVPPSVVLSTVRRCRRELDIVSGPALPELIERLGRQRLSDLVAVRTHGPAVAHRRSASGSVPVVAA